MRPVKLVISAFGPYADTMPEIDFSKFDGKGLFRYERALHTGV